MFELNIPGFGNLEIKNIVLDYNGTIAKDGVFFSELTEIINELSGSMDIYVITADTFGTVENNLSSLNVKIHKLKSDFESQEKHEFVKSLGSENTLSIGNGSNDALMLKESRVGICIMGEEGCSQKALSNSDIVIRNTKLALELLKNPQRLKATLRY